MTSGQRLPPEVRDLTAQRSRLGDPGTGRRLRRTIYDEAAKQALIVLWEASDRVCGKRLKPLLRILLPALERHGHLKLDEVIRTEMLAMSVATIDRLLRAARDATRSRKPRRVTPEMMLIDDNWVSAVSGKTFEVKNPASGETIAYAAEGDGGSDRDGEVGFAAALPNSSRTAWNRDETARVPWTSCRNL
ncbi:MAG TPA: hypothetical protein VFX20_17510 [Steroidobacteraceae bacterium]|nr:hypothetical protein [Steroidobacteraceae bacterium]